MSSTVLKERTVREIDDRVARILKDLGDPEPPLDLSGVRELLRLDVRYYSISEPGFLDEVMHRLTIGAKQVIERPTRIIDAVRNRSLRALWIPDGKRILIDGDLHALKKRWGEGHEVIHSIIPHHQVLTLGDPEFTLSPGCHEQLEAEANFGAGRLLFLREGFRDRLLASPVTFENVKSLSKIFANSMTATLWRTIETLDIPAAALVSEHPWSRASAGPQVVKHFIRSGSFASRFGGVNGDDLFQGIASIVRRRGGGPLGEAERVVMDADGVEHLFHIECFGNTYDTLTLCPHKCRRRVAIAVP